MIGPVPTPETERCDMEDQQASNLLSARLALVALATMTLGVVLGAVGLVMTTMI